MADVEIGEMAFYGVCAGCHSYNNIVVGPTIKDIQMIYKDKPEGIVAFITKPTHKRPDSPEMPSQEYLPLKVREAVAKYMLSIKK